MDDGAILGTGLLGLLIGALYRWKPAEDGVGRLWAVGVGFSIVVGAAWSSLPWMVAERVLLWTWLCVMLLVGRTLRLRLYLFHLNRKHRRYTDHTEEHE